MSQQATSEKVVFVSTTGVGHDQLDGHRVDDSGQNTSLGIGKDTLKTKRGYALDGPSRGICEKRLAAERPPPHWQL